MVLSCSKKLSALLRGITSKKMTLFIVWVVFIPLEQKNKLELHKKVCENKNFCNVIMPSEDTKVLKSNNYQKSDKVPFNIYADLECIIENIDGCKFNPENWSTTKVRRHILSGFSMSTIPSFRYIENQHDICGGKDCIKKFCWFSREHAMKIINFKKKEKWNY